MAYAATHSTMRRTAKIPPGPRKCWEGLRTIPLKKLPLDLSANDTWQSWPGLLHFNGLGFWGWGCRRSDSGRRGFHTPVRGTMFSAVTLWRPDRHANATSPSCQGTAKTLHNHCVTVRWRRAGCRVAPYRHPGWHANVVPQVKVPSLQKFPVGAVGRRTDTNLNDTWEGCRGGSPRRGRGGGRGAWRVSVGNLGGRGGRLIFIHLRCWEMLSFLTIQRQRCIKILCPKDPEFHTPLALNCRKGQHLPALEVYKNQSPRGGGLVFLFGPEIPANWVHA